MFDFTGKVVIVTGAAGNLGSAVAQGMLVAGANLVLVDHARDRFGEMFPQLVGSDDHLLFEGVDLTDPESVKALVESVIARFGKIDALVNTVGGYRAGDPLHETSLDTLDFLLTLNARTVFIVCQAVIPHMLAQGSGKIVNVSARSGLSGSKNHAAYSSAKAVVIRLTESMAAELKGKGINVNCVLPGTIDTPQNRAQSKADTSKWVTPEALADAILFLASDAARAVHGVALPVYGLS